MADKYIDIHGYKVRYDDESETAKNAVHYLTEKLDDSETRVFFDEAKKNTTDHVAHFKVRNYERNKDDELTLVDEGDGSFHLRKREHNFF